MSILTHTQFFTIMKKGDTIMKTDIYYFSGSGNSLDVAQKLGKRIENAKLISIPHIINRSNEIRGEVIGIVCPIYFYNMPHIVRDFIKKIVKAKYLFMVYAGTGDLGNGLKTTKNLFAAQNIKLSSVFNIPMPENSTVHVEPEEKEQEKLNNVDKKVDEIMKVVNEKKEHFDGRNVSNRSISLFQTYIYPGLLFKFFVYPSLKTMDKDFTVDQNCIGCSTCQKICPVNNITMKDDKPVWNVNNQCQTCLACYNWCPEKAISHPSVNAEMKRYHNPNIKVKDIISSSA